MPRPSQKPVEATPLEEKDVTIMTADEYSDHEMEKLKKDNPRKYIRLTIEREPKTTMLIPKEQGEHDGYMHKFTISEVEFMYPKGEMIEVPMTIANMIKERWYQSSMTEKAYNLRNAGHDKLNALS